MIDPTITSATHDKVCGACVFIPVRLSYVTRVAEPTAVEWIIGKFADLFETVDEDVLDLLDAVHNGDDFTHCSHNRIVLFVIVSVCRCKDKAAFLPSHVFPLFSDDVDATHPGSLRQSKDRSVIFVASHALLHRFFFSLGKKLGEAITTALLFCSLTVR